MSPFTRLMEDIYCIDIRIAHTNTPFVSYLIAGNPAVLIESGPTSATPGLLEALDEIGQDPEDIANVIPTHIHMDHAGGVGELARQWPWVKIVLHEQGAQHLIDPTKLIAGTKRAFGNNFEDIYGPIVAVKQSQVLRVSGGEKLPLGNRNLRVIHAPGHAPHHICVYDESTKGLFCGEAMGVPLGESGMIMPPAIPPAFDLEASLDTIDRVESLDPSILFYSHGGHSKDVGERLQAARTILRRVGDLVLSGLKEGKDFDGLLKQVTQGLSQDGFPEGDVDYSGVVAGYMLYFQKLEKGQR